MLAWFLIITMRRLDLENDYPLNQQVFEDIIETMKLFAKEIGKNGEKSLMIPFWDQTRRTRSLWFIHWEGVLWEKVWQKV